MQERTYGPEHPQVAETLSQFATLLRNTKRKKEAGKLEQRAERIRAQHRLQNPSALMVDAEELAR
jgi:hypothetical protein